jgi:hypothetical protein
MKTAAFRNLRGKRASAALAKEGSSPASARFGGPQHLDVVYKPIP